MKSIIEKFDEQVLYKSKDGTRYNCMSSEEERLIKQFFQSELERIAERVISEWELRECDKEEDGEYEQWKKDFKDGYDKKNIEIINIFKEEGVIK